MGYVKEPSILISEEAIKHLKNGKAPGVHNITAESLKNRDDIMSDILHKICNIIWETEEWPTQRIQTLWLC